MTRKSITTTTIAIITIPTIMHGNNNSKAITTMRITIPTIMTIPTIIKTIITIIITKSITI